MRQFALTPVGKLPLACTGLALLALASVPIHAQPDPPAQAGRISYITGNVSFQPVGSTDWGQAFPNNPLGPGDRIFTDSDGRAEIQVGQTFVRIGPNSDVSLVDSTPEGLYFGVAQGSVHMMTLGLWQGQAVYVNTPSGTSVEDSSGELRVDVYPQESAAIFTDWGGTQQIMGAGGFAQDLAQGQALELAGSNPVSTQWLRPADGDPLDFWSRERDRQIARAASYRYLSPEIPGGYEMDAAGTWIPNTPYGPAWFPNNVDAGWAPYHNGHWVNHQPWGWVWVEEEPWGYAPFHYGRWVSLNGRWGWIPGPPAQHPIWSPALVVFAGGVNFGGSTVSAWFPLGPGEAYHPWYPCSPRYINQVNITNITVTNVVHVQTTYVNVTNVTYVNRSIGVTAMRHEDFAAGRPALEAAVAIDVHQMERVQPLAAPVPRPTAAAIVGRPPVRAVPVSVARPVLINSKGMAVSATPGARPMAPPVKAAPAVIKTLPGHAVVAPPANAVKVQPGAKMPPPPGRPDERSVPAAAAPVKPATEPAMKTPPPPANKPITPEPTKPLVKPAPIPETKAPGRPEDKAPVEPNNKPPVPKTAVEPNKPPAPKPGVEPDELKKEVKPGTVPPGKNDKDKKNEKDKDKKDEKDKPQ